MSGVVEHTPRTENFLLGSDFGPPQTTANPFYNRIKNTGVHRISTNRKSTETDCVSVCFGSNRKKGLFVSRTPCCLPHLRVQTLSMQIKRPLLLRQAKWVSLFACNQKSYCLEIRLPNPMITKK
jgi:hypothetical protein